MKRFFIDKKFASAEELLNYLLSLKDQKFGQLYGVYCAKMHTKEQQFRFIEDFFFPSLTTYRIIRRKLVEYGENTTCTLYLRKGRLYCISLTSDTLTCYWDKVKNQWKETSRDNCNPRKKWLAVTEKEKRACVASLLETLSIKAQKIG